MKEDLKGDAAGLRAKTTDNKDFQLDLTGATKVNVVKQADGSLVLNIKFKLALLKVPPIGKSSDTNSTIKIPATKVKEGEMSIASLTGLSTVITYIPTTEDFSGPGDIAISFPIPGTAYLDPEEK